MKIRVVSTCFNEEAMLPFYLRHYSVYSNDIRVYDDSSTDRSREIISNHPNAKLLNWPFKPGMNDDLMLDLWYQCMEEAQFDEVDWLILPDIDEIIWSSDLVAILRAADVVGWEVLAVQGWNMVGALPEDDGRQIWELSQLGVREPVYSKPIVVKPRSNIRWVPGRHHQQSQPRRLCPVHMMKLLHYRFLNPEYTLRRNSKNHSRIAVARETTWNGDMDLCNYGSPQYAHEISSIAVNAIEDKILGT